MGGDNGEKGKDHHGKCIKDPWIKPKGSRIESGTWGWMGRGEWWHENGDNCT